MSCSVLTSCPHTPPHSCGALSAWGFAPSHRPMQCAGHQWWLGSTALLYTWNESSLSRAGLELNVPCVYLQMSPPSSSAGAWERGAVLSPLSFEER
jgi:hypothetical protein